jgi:uncharacterized protein (TIGR02996 family)
MPIPPLDSTAQALFQTILREPEEDTPRLAYADRLMELGDEETECSECKTKSDEWFKKWVCTCDNTRVVIDHTNTLHAELIREMIKNGNEMALGVGISIWAGRLAPPLPGVAFTVRRGFVDGIACTLERFTELFNTCDGTLPTKAEFMEEMRRKYPWPLTNITMPSRNSMNGEGGWQWELDVDGDRFYDRWATNYLPRFLFERLPGKWKNPHGIRGAYKKYPTEAASHAALSSACLSWFRSVCGIKEVR